MESECEKCSTRFLLHCLHSQHFAFKMKSSSSQHYREIQFEYFQLKVLCYFFGSYNKRLLLLCDSVTRTARLKEIDWGENHVQHSIRLCRTLTADSIDLDLFEFGSVFLFRVLAYLVYACELSYVSDRAAELVSGLCKLSRIFSQNSEHCTKKVSRMKTSHQN